MKSLRVGSWTTGFLLLGLRLALAQGPINDLPPLDPPNGAAQLPADVPSTPRDDLVPDRQPGPPATQPQEEVGPPPARGTFYIPGAYVPQGKRVVWRPGYWARSRPGWEWIPSRWERRSEGWTFREGYWNRARERGDLAPDPFVTRSSNARPRPPLVSEPVDPADRHVVARPSAGPSDLRDDEEPRPTANPNAVEPNAPDLQPIPEAGAPGLVPPGGTIEPPPAPPAPGNGEAPAPDPEDAGPQALIPAPRPGPSPLPIPFWDGSTLVVPPTRFSAGVVVPTAPRVDGNRVLYPMVGILPPTGGRNRASRYPGPMPPPGYVLPPRGPGGLIPWRMRDFLDRVLP